MEEGDLIGQMARDMVDALERGEVIDPDKEAEELQEMFRVAAELEQKQNQLVDDESELPPVQMEEIHQIPIMATATFETTEEDTAEASSDETVTVIPISVTSDPWAEPIVASAAMDAWAALRQQYGGVTKRRGRRK